MRVIANCGLILRVLQEVVVMSNPKVYVSVSTSFDHEGRMFPREIRWEDGTIYEIDKILDIRQAAALDVGSGGD